MNDNFLSNDSNINNDNLSNSQYIKQDNSERGNNTEFYDSLNISNKSSQKNYNDYNCFNNISFNNEDSVLQEAYNSLSKLPKKNNNIEKSDKNNYIYNNNYSIDNNQENIIFEKNTHEDENVNLGVSYSKISDKEKIINNKDINNYEKNNNKGVITPNTSIYNLSETISKKSGIIDNINIENNNNIINKDKKPNINNKNDINIFEEDSLCENYKKKNISVVEYNINNENNGNKLFNQKNQNEDENKLILNINTQFSNIKKIEENENEDKIENNLNINKIINNKINNSILKEKDNISTKKIIKHNDIISKRFELIKKNKKQLLNTSSSTPINTISSNYILKNTMFNNTENNFNNNINTNNNIYRNSLINSINVNNNYIYLCPYCNKETPEVLKLEGIQNDIKDPTIDKISIICSCGIYYLDLKDYINILEQKNTYQNFNENCYNENHGQIKASCYCSKCNKWFCEKCLNFHKSLLSDHFTTPTKIPRFSKCSKHTNDDIIYFCHKCNIGICDKCKSLSHNDHYISSLNDYFNKTYKSLPFKSFEELNEYIEHCNRISEKEKNSYIKYIEDMINKLNELKNNIIENYNISKARRIAQQKLIKYLFGNFICFSDNYLQIKNMNSINYICPTLFLYNDINFLKSAYNYSLYLKKESFIEINPDKKLNKEEINNIFEKYRAKLKEIKNNNSLDSNIKILNTDYNSNKTYINTLQSESNFIFPTLFKIYNSTGIYYGEINNNKRNGIGKQFNKKDEYEGLWKDGEIILGKAKYFSEQGNIIYEGEFKDGLENGYGEKIYPNNRVYKGIFINGKIDAKYEIQKRLEIPSN